MNAVIDTLRDDTRLPPLQVEESREFRSYHNFLRAARNYMEGPLVAQMHDAYDAALERTPGEDATLAADKGYDTTDFVQDCTDRWVVPHIARNISGTRGSAVPDDVAATPEYAISIIVRRRIEQIFGCMKEVGGFRRTRSRGRPRVRAHGQLVAAAYNLLFGAFAVLFPLAWFEWGGMPAPNMPSLWQCIGMIVGVYGIGYGIAAFAPLRHWPIVLVGLLGKVFGPIGFLDAALRGEMPWRCGWLIVTNDLIWWLPFTALLLAARRAHRSRAA
jgi:hypothetical protein